MDVPEDVVARLRGICLGLPEAFEEQAWVGTRWKVRTRTFAHVVTVERGWPEAYAKAFRLTADAGPVVTLTFRSPGLERDALVGGGHPFYAPPWAPDVVGMVLDDDPDWTEVAELLTESFCALAPRKLAERVPRPSALSRRFVTGLDGPASRWPRWRKAQVQPGTSNLSPPCQRKAGSADTGNEPPTQGTSG